MFENCGFDFLEYCSFSYVFTLPLVSSSVIKDSLLAHKMGSEVYFIPAGGLLSIPPLRHIGNDLQIKTLAKYCTYLASFLDHTKCSVLCLDNLLPSAPRCHRCSGYRYDTGLQMQTCCSYQSLAQSTGRICEVQWPSKK